MTSNMLERRQVLPAPLEEVFAFFKDPLNLSIITPPWLNFRVRRMTDPVVRRGTRIGYDIRWMGLPMRWESVIAEYVEGERFADEMIRGPYTHWYHLHTFRRVPNGTEVGDRVDYELPLGPVGRLAHRVLVRRQLEGIFEYRTRRLKKIFPKDPG